MGIGNIIFIVVLSVIAGSYGWAMRGTIIGGERGCYLPGAMLGLILAYASGVEQIKENFWIFAALGAAAMFFGGAHSYGQTIGMSHDRENRSRRLRGRVGMTVKGASWFGIYGGLMGIAFGAAAGKYKVYELIILAVCLPIAKKVGLWVLGSPQKPLEGKFPKFYFSEGRFEICAGLLFVFLEILIFSIVKGEMFAILMCIFGYVGGGLGFLIGNLFQTSTPQQGINGKFLLGKLQKNGYVGSWKFMEFTGGAVGGLFTSLGFCLFFDKTDYTEIINTNGFWKPLGEWDSRLGYIWLAIFIAYTLLYLIPEPRPYYPDIKAKFESGQISDTRFEELSAISTNTPPSKFLVWLKYASNEIFIWPVFAYIPVGLALLSCLSSSKIVSGFLVYWVLSEEIIFSRQDKNNIQYLTATRIGLFVIPAAILLAQIGGFTFTAWQLWIIYFISYELMQLWEMFSPMKIKRMKAESGTIGKGILNLKSGLSVRTFSLIEIVAALVMGSVFFS